MDKKIININSFLVKYYPILLLIYTFIGIFWIGLFSGETSHFHIFVRYAFQLLLYFLWGISIFFIYQFIKIKSIIKIIFLLISIVISYLFYIGSARGIFSEDYLFPLR